MPELPEVEVLKRSLQKKIRFCKIIRIKIYNRNLRYKVPYSINRNLKNHVVNNISRISKYLIFHINFSKKLLIHLGMSGTIHLMEKNNKNNTNASFYHSLYLPSCLLAISNIFEFGSSAYTVPLFFICFRNNFAISPVPDDISSKMVFLFGESQLIICFFHNLCEPKDIMSFIKSYLSKTLSNTF